MHKKRLLVLLSILFLVNLMGFGFKLIPHFLIIVSVAVAADYLLVRLRKITPFFPWAAVDSGMIIAFVLDPSSQFFFKIIIPVLAVASKHCLRRSGRHIFNPAAAGLFIGALFGASILWWVNGPGTARLFSGFLSDAVLTVGAFFILRRMNRLWLPLSFLISFFIVRLLIFQELNLWFSLIFFPLIMLPEPMTSPAAGREQLVDGALVAFLVVFLGFAHLNLVDSYLESLLVANLLFRFGVVRKLVGFLGL